MRTMNFDVIATSAPLNREASVVRDGSGDTWDFQPPPQMEHWKAPPLPVGRRPETIADLTGRVFGRLTVIRFHGKPEGKNALNGWLVRCVCGDYEVRTNKTLKKAANPNDCCCVCAKADRLKERAARTPTKRDLKRQRASFRRIVGEAA